MTENESKQADEKSKFVSVDKKADILQANFKHYYGMAMDHHTKAGTTSNIILVIVGAILILVGLDRGICRSEVDIVSAIALISLGLFGAAWAWRQNERYRYWEFIAIAYQKEIQKIMPELKTRCDYRDKAKEHVKKKFRPFFTDTLEDRYLWVLLHLFIIIIGAAILILSLLNTCQVAP